MKKTRISVFLAVVLFGLTGCGVSLAQDITPPPEVANIEINDVPVEQESTPAASADDDFSFDAVPDMGLGQLIFTENCSACHGPDGLIESMEFNGTKVEVREIGNPAFRDNYSPQEWFQLITDGKMENLMPPFGELLTADEIWAVTAYTFGLNLDEQAIAAGQDVYAARCSNCHGELGTGDSGRSPAPLDFTDQAKMSAYSNTDLLDLITNGSGQMPAFAGRITEVEISNVMLYARSFAFPVIQQDAVEETEATEEPVIDTTEIAAPEIETTIEIDADGNFSADISGVVIPSGSMADAAGLEVTLLGVDPDGNGFTAEVTVSEDNSFLFEDVGMGHGWQFLATVTVDGTQFPADTSLSILDAQSNYQFIVHLYDTTHAVDDLVYENIHVFVEPVSDTAIRVIEAFTVSNYGEAMVVPLSDVEPVLEFGLPAGAENLSFMDQNAAAFIVSVPGGIGDLTYVPVGESTYSMILYFELPAANEYSIDIPLQFSLGEAFLFLSDESLESTSEQFVFEGMQTVMNTDPSQMYSASGLAAGDTLQIKIEGDPGFLGLGNLSINTDVMIGGLVLVLAAGVITYWVRRGRQSIEPSEEEDLQAVLLDRIVALDEAFNTGQLDEVEYRQQRNALKAELADYLEE